MWIHLHKNFSPFTIKIIISRWSVIVHGERLNREGYPRWAVPTNKAFLMGKKRSKSPNLPLNILADFLNFDFEKDDPAKLRGKDAAHMIAFLHWTNDDEPKILQAEIRKEL